MDELSEDTLKAAAKGDVDAFEQVYRTYASFVYNVAYRMVGNKEDAEEVTQEVFLIVHRKLNSFLFRSSLKTWIYRITANYAINVMKKESRQHKGRVAFEDALNFIPDPQDVRQIIEQQDRNEQVRQMLEVLNPQERACMVLRNIQGLSYEEIAQSLNVNINTVRTRLKRAREKILKHGQEVVKDEV